MDNRVSVAPSLQGIIMAELEAPRLGTLVFHPSMLPMYPGKDAIQQALQAGDSFSGVSWFWATEDVDGGDIAEQQVVTVPPNVSAGRFYHTHLVPAGIEAFACLWRQLELGYRRRVSQQTN